MNVLLVEDSAALARNIARYLEAEDYSVTIAADGEAALRLVDECEPSIVILDLNLPKVDGMEVCRRLRRDNHSTPIIMVTARSSKTDVVAGLDAGADDYLVKPFDMEELVARIRALTRRGTARSSIVTFGACTLDPVSRDATCNGEIVHLAPKEYALVEYLALHQGEPQTRDAIIDAVWGGELGASSLKTLQVHVVYVRRKLGQRAIETVPHVGYMIAGDTRDA